MAAPAPLAKVGAERGADAAVAPSTEEQFFARAVLQPPVDAAPAGGATRNSFVAGLATKDPVADSGAGKWVMLIGTVVFLVATVATAWFVIRPTAGARNQTPVVLSPRPATAGLPTSLEVIVRVEAESTRHNALQTVAQMGTADVAQLASRQPNYTWVAGDQASTDSHVVSVAQNAGAGAVTIAVAASNHDVCAFGQWSSAGTMQYVTMAHESTCAAVNAPRVGWSSEAGGAASDLPDENG